MGNGQSGNKGNVMKYVYCSRCGTCLEITRKALPKYGKIINIISPHECPDEPVELNLTPVDVPIPSATGEGNDKFVQNLNGLQPQPSTIELGDRRDIADIKKETSSTAPRTLLDNIQSMHNTTPANDVRSEPEGE